MWVCFYVNVVLELNDEWDVIGVYYFYCQGSYQEIFLGFGGCYYLDYQGEDL